MQRLVCSLILLAAASGRISNANAQEAVESDETVGTAVTADGDEINPRGRHSDDLTNKSARYFVWYDGEDWHLRSASKRKRLRRFNGTIKLTGGTFAKLRPVGFERKGSAADTWQGSEDRTEVEFDIKTTSSFDGIDFSVTGSDAVITFDLKIGNKQRAGRIFIGNDGLHPSQAEFSFPADP